MTSILKADEIQDSSGNLIIKEVANAITIGASGDTITIPSGATITNSGTATGFGGITVADQWRLTSAFSMTSSTTETISSNLERVDTSGQGTIGTAMSESSGVFTFPSTGIYLVSFNASYGLNNSSRWIEFTIQATTNNSSYSHMAMQNTFIQQTDSNTTYSAGYANSLIDVTDTANVKVRFGVARAANTVSLTGSSSENQTYFTFIRLGDT